MDGQKSDEATIPGVATTPGVAEDSVSIVTAASADAPSTYSESADLIKLFKNVTPDCDRPMYRKDILFAGSVQALPEYNENMGKCLYLTVYCDAITPCDVTRPL